MNLCRSFYKHVLGLPVDFNDIEAIDPAYYKNLKTFVLEMPLAESGLENTYTFSAELETFGRQEVRNKFSH